MTITLDDRDYKIKLSGTIENPYFCGRDVCKILGYENIKKALQKHVKSKHKKEISNLLGSFNPNKLGPILGPNSLGSKEPLSYNIW